ncbi:MAG: preprotein translocase subunit SecA [Patescibacteria group bacterium]
MALLTKVFGDPNAKEIKKIQPLIQEINAMEAGVLALSDDEIRAEVAGLRERAKNGEDLDALLTRMFALTREATKRTMHQSQYDVQLMGGIALHRGTIAEMRTGEGKTLTAVAPIALNALAGKGTHLVTVNDYLARRDMAWMGQVYHFLGLSVGCIQHEGGFLYDPHFKNEPEHDAERDATGNFRVDMDYLRPCSRREAYAADITYGTNNEFGFDYLRDNMVQRPDQMAQRELNFAIVDEVDSILIDEARTPLIISGPAAEPAELYYRMADLVPLLVAEEDYKIDEKQRTSTLTASGISKMEKWLNVDNLYTPQGMRTVHHLEQALRAQALYKLDKDYVVKDGEVIIVDEFTGRLMQGRRYSEGLHQAIEAKEHVKIQRESITVATITFQNFFRLYEKLSGMTGTAETEAEEFSKIYNLEVLVIPPNRPSQRRDAPDRIYKTEVAKFKAVVADVKELQKQGQPVLIGTASIEKNELLSAFLTDANVPHEILNAKNHEREGSIIAQAGRKGAVTLATNMAGRGVDIILGGNPPEESIAKEVRDFGGLHVLGTERHESRRIDNQLRGRAGRQGDPGSTQFYLSLEDDLMRIFGGDRVKGVMEALKVPEDMPIEEKILSKLVEQSQKRVEGHNFDIRKHLLEYDDVLNKHRTSVYGKRRMILNASIQPTEEGVRPLQRMVLDAIEGEVEQMVMSKTEDEDPNAWDIQGMIATSTVMIPGFKAGDAFTISKEELEGKLDHATRRDTLVSAIMSEVKRVYGVLEETVGDPSIIAEVERAICLRAIDEAWIEHLENVGHMRHGIGLQGYGQRDPLVEYKRQAYGMFMQMQTQINRQIAGMIFRVQINRESFDEDRAKREATTNATNMQAMEEGAERQDRGSGVGVQGSDKIGRNDPCFCGSGKKYKRCHGA